MRPIHVGQWLFYPQFMAAQNTHNGAIARFYETPQGWRGCVINCPADWMFRELGEWFAKWITGALSSTKRDTPK